MANCFPFAVIVIVDIAFICVLFIFAGVKVVTMLVTDAFYRLHVENARNQAH